MKKHIIRTIILLLCFILAMAFPGCTRYYTPDQAANHKTSFEKRERREEKKLMKKERQNRNIDPLKWNK